MSSIGFFDIKNCFDKTDLDTILEDKKKLFKEKSSIHHSEKKQYCNTCRQEIDSDISRILIMRDKDMGPRLFCFHFFFPCWDFEQLCHSYPELILDTAGFSVPENINIKESSIEDLQKNLEFWN